MDISGVLYKKMPIQTGVGKTGNSWSKMDFIIDFQDEMGNYKKLALSAWGERVDLLERIAVGEKLSIQFDVASREYNDRWYTDITARRITSGGEAAPRPEQPSAGYQQAPPAPAPQAAAAPASDNISDDLPF